MEEKKEGWAFLVLLMVLLVVSMVAYYQATAGASRQYPENFFNHDDRCIAVDAPVK